MSSTDNGGVGITIDTKLVERWINSKSKLFFKNAMYRISRASWMFITWLTLAQLSGRKRPDYGLNVVTGTLRRSFKARTVGNSSVGDIATKVYTTAKYAMVHEEGSEKRNIPQRLRVRESYLGAGLRMYKTGLAEAIKDTANARV